MSGAMSSNGTIRGYVDPNFPNPMGPNDARIIIYGYTPSLALGILGVVLFAIALLIHVWQLRRYRSWYFTPVAVGAAMEIVGYAFRLLSTTQSPYSVPWFVVQYFFIVVAPVLFSAAIYTVVSRIIRLAGPQSAPLGLSPRTVLVFFIACDVLATVVQVAGAALVGSRYSNQEDPTTANNILLAGLVFQVFAFAVFLLLLALTLRRVHILSRSRTQTGSEPAAGAGTGIKLDRAFLVALVVATLAVYLRTCFRLAETAEGLMARLATHEAYFGCLEFLPVVVATYLLAGWHPGRYLDRQSNTPGARDSHDTRAEVVAMPSGTESAEKHV